jgi:hypothetical protein
MRPTRNTARLAGFLYLLMGLPAPFCLIYIPRTLIERGDASATAENILANQTLFQLGIVGQLVTVTLFIFLAMVLYRLLNRVNRMHAALMVILVLVSIPVSLFSLLNELGALALIRGSDYLAVFSGEQVDALAYLLLVIRGQALQIAQIFWGLWLIPFGLLVMRSGFLPRILGMLLIVNGIAYPILSLTSLFFPDYRAVAGRILFPALLGELSIMLWLLIRGARIVSLPAAEQPDTTAVAPAEAP